MYVGISVVTATGVVDSSVTYSYVSHVREPRRFRSRRVAVTTGHAWNFTRCTCGTGEGGHGDRDGLLLLLYVSDSEWWDGEGGVEAQLSWTTTAAASAAEGLSGAATWNPSPSYHTAACVAGPPVKDRVVYSRDVLRGSTSVQCTIILLLLLLSLPVIHSI